MAFETILELVSQIHGSGVFKMFTHSNEVVNQNLSFTIPLELKESRSVICSTLLLVVI